MLRFLNSYILFIFTAICYPDAVRAIEPLLFLLFKFIWGIFSFGISKHCRFEHACNCLLAQCADAKFLGYGSDTFHSHWKHDRPTRWASKLFRGCSVSVLIRKRWPAFTVFLTCTSLTTDWHSCTASKGMLKQLDLFIWNVVCIICFIYIYILKSPLIWRHVSHNLDTNCCQLLNLKKYYYQFKFAYSISDALW